MPKRRPELDTTTASGRLMFNLLGSVGEWERMAIGERTEAALAAKKARGERPGRPVTLDLEVCARIAAERAAGRTLQSIADSLNGEGVPTASGDGVWYASTVLAVVRSVTLDHAVLEAAQTAQGTA